ncbi:hypothetical protein CTZ27_17880 [Streptomyces griseocarneus]|nr:hypothetical protein CTZ27_17880 [Streptomyces griseocarneus]
MRTVVLACMDGEVRGRAPAAFLLDSVCAFPRGGTRTTVLRTVSSPSIRRGDGMAKCGAPTKTGGWCRRKVVTGTSRCPVHQGAWSAYGVAQRKEKEAKEKKRTLRRKR